VCHFFIAGETRMLDRDDCDRGKAAVETDRPPQGKDRIAPVSNSYVLLYSKSRFEHLQAVVVRQAG